MRSIVVALVAAIAGCGGLSRDDQASIEHAAVLASMAYHHEDASTPAAALMRGSYCSSDAVIRRQKLAPVDAGISCELSP